MFRNLFLVIAIIALIWIIKGLIRRSKTPAAHTRIEQDMVQCAQCKTYLPKDDAIVINDQAFCSHQHLDEWKQKH